MLHHCCTIAAPLLHLYCTVAAPLLHHCCTIAANRRGADGSNLVRCSQYSLHAGCDVINGTKWAANYWLWNTPQMSSFSQNSDIKAMLQELL